jgi:hypothetical protein
MTRGSGSADPGVRTVVKKCYDDARIRRVRIRASEPLLIFMMTRGSGSTDPDVRIVIQEFSMMTRGSGEYGSGRRNRYVENYDDARIRECGSGRRKPVIWKIMMTRGPWSADPGVTHPLRGLYSQFYFWVHT